MQKKYSDFFKILFIGIVLCGSLYLNYFFRIEVKLYTNIFFIVIVLTAYWFYKQAILVAIILSIVQVAVEALYGELLIVPLIRCGVFIAAAFFLYYQRENIEHSKLKIAANAEKDKKMLDRNSILFEISNRSYITKEEQLEFILGRLLGMTGSAHGLIFLYDEVRGEFTLQLWSKSFEKMEAILKESILQQLETSAFWGEVVCRRQTRADNDFVIQITDENGFPRKKYDIRGMLVVPVVFENKTVAIVGLMHKKGGYKNDDAYQVSTLMEGIWSAVERRETQRMLEFEKNKYLSTILSIGDGVLVCNREGRIDMINQVAGSMTGWDCLEAKGRHYSEILILTHESEFDKVIDPIAEVFRTDEAQTLSNHVMLISRNGSVIFLEDSAAPIKDADKKTIGAVLVFRNVTEKREQRKKIEYLSYHDALTGLYNRRFFEEEIMRLDSQRNYPLTILIGDLNGLKLINDAFGHKAGDEFIKSAAKLIQDQCRQEDIISRWGGDEFAVLLPKTDNEEAEKIVERINQAALKLNLENGVLSIAFGWNTKTNLQGNIETVFKEAEDSMYRIKNSENKVLREETIKTIMNTLFEKSPREKAHSLRVSQFATELARELKMTQEEISIIENLGLMHDIGKIIIASDILEKPEKLSNSEYQKITKHPEIGYRILSSSVEMGNLAEGVMDHHEKWDGSGYLNGKKGNEISIQSRIIAIADAFDVMTTNSSYRNKMSVDEAICEIIQNAGKQFDPELAYVFVTKVLKSEWVT